VGANGFNKSNLLKLKDESDWLGSARKYSLGKFHRYNEAFSSSSIPKLLADVPYMRNKAVREKAIVQVRSLEAVSVLVSIVVEREIARYAYISCNSCQRKI
jgi:hypothetical protein